MVQVQSQGQVGSAIESYRDLKVWQAAIELAVACYEGTRPFPANEMYGLTSQIRRAATSVAANIAEGYGRENVGSYIQFLRIAQGSLKELETHVLIAARVDCLGGAGELKLLRQSEIIGKMLRALVRSLQKAT